MPRVGAESVSQTAAAGEQTAQVRNAVTFLNTLPLLAAAFNEAGAAMNGTGAGAVVIDQLDAAVAKDIAADRGNNGKGLRFIYLMYNKNRLLAFLAFFSCGVSIS